MKKEMLVLAAGAALVIACSNPPKAPVEGVATTTAGVIANEDAATRLAKAKCDYAKGCNNIGKDKDYGDENAA